MRALGIILMAVLTFAACKKTVEGETKSWEANKKKGLAGLHEHWQAVTFAQQHKDRSKRLRDDSRG